MSVEFVGLEGILDKLDNLANPQKMEQAMKKACALVQGSAMKKAKKGKTGDLARSIATKVENDGINIVGTVYSPLIYAPYREYGTGLFAEDGNGRKDVPWHYQDDEGEWHTTSGMKPAPFLRPALNENKDNVTRILKGALRDD